MDHSKSDAEIENKFAQTETFWSNEHFAEHNQKLQVFFENQQFCDIKLISADDKYEVMAHKIVLASVSEFFLGMFGGSFTEANKNEVKLDDIDGDSLKLIINFIYSGLIELSADTVEGIIKASHFFRLSSLVKLCCTYMKKNIDVSNCLGISLFAEQHNIHELYDAALLCVCENFSALKNQDEFLSLNSGKLCEIISRDDLRIGTEEDVFHSIMAWIDYDKDNRKKFFEELLHCVRYALLTRTFIDSKIKPLCESVDSLRFVSNAYKWHADRDLWPTGCIRLWFKNI